MVMSSLRTAALRRGVDIRTGVLATGIEVTRDAVTAVQTTDGPVACGILVVAAGLWSPQLCSRLGLEIPMQRVRAPAVETAPFPPGTIPGFLRAATFGARQNRNGTMGVTGGYRYSAMLHDVSLHDFRDLRVWGPAFVKNRKDVSLRINPSALRAEARSAWSSVRHRKNGVSAPQGYIPPSSPRDRRTQLRDLGELVSAVRGARIHRSFSGVIDLVPDLQPVIGQIPGSANAYVATGFSGHGYMYGPGACRAISSLIVDGDPGIDLHPYRPERLNEKLTMRAQIF
jgi:sarcosine oxidase subunit beta